jgi:hypothetical protein
MYIYFTFHKYIFCFHVLQSSVFPLGFQSILTCAVRDKCYTHFSLTWEPKLFYANKYCETIVNLLKPTGYVMQQQV